MAILPVPTDIRKAKYQFPSQYVGDLRSKIGYYIDYVPEETDLEQFFETLRNDPEIDHCIDLLSVMVAGNGVEVAGSNPVVVRVCNKALHYIQNFGHSRKSITQKAVLFGLSVQKKYWRRVFWPETGLTWEVPYRLAEVDRRRLRLERDHDSKRVYWTIWSPEFDAYLRLDDRSVMPDASLAVQDFLWTFYETEEQSPYFRGKGEVLYGLAYMTSKVLQYWGDLAEHWGRPFMDATVNIAKAMFNAGGEYGSGSVDVDALVAKWLDILENMRARHSIVKTDADSISVHESGTTGNNLLKELIDWLGLKKQLCILGSELTTIAPSVGSYALGLVHQGVVSHIIRYNRQNLKESLSGLLYDFYMRNRLNFAAIGVRYWPGPDEVAVKIVGEMPRGEAPEEAKNGEMPRGEAPEEAKNG